MNHFHLNLSKDQELSTLPCLHPSGNYKLPPTTQYLLTIFKRHSSARRGGVKKVSEKVPEVAGSNPYATGRREGSSGGRESERERGSAGGFCPHPLAIAKLLASSAAYEDRFGGGSLPSPVRGLITAAVAAESLFLTRCLLSRAFALGLQEGLEELGKLGKKAWIACVMWLAAVPWALLQEEEEEEEQKPLSSPPPPSSQPQRSSSRRSSSSSSSASWSLLSSSWLWCC